MTLVIGAGPTGLACGIELQKRGLKAVLIDKGCVVNSLYHYPTHMTFFTTPELLEIGDIPMTSINDKPNRTEALKYYRRVADHYQLDITSTRGSSASRATTAHSWFARRTASVTARLRGKKIILATGYYDLPNRLNVPGEDTPKVIHYYKEPHPYYNMDVVVVGAKNSRPSPRWNCSGPARASR